MAIGDVKAGIASVGSGQRYDIRPPVGEEWIIHNVYYDSNIDMIMTNGVDSITFDRDTSQGARMGMVTHIKNDFWLQLYNYTAGTPLKIAYDGIQTK